MCRRSRRTSPILFAALALPFPPPGPMGTAAAQDFVLPRLEGSVVVDGRPDESAWALVPPLPLTMFEPEFGGEITRRSTIRVAHDGEYLYAAGVFEDDGPIRGHSLIRDHYAEDDVFNLVIDSFHDRETAFWFVVMPRGTRQDGMITDDAEGAQWNRVEFDNVWDAAAVITPSGWQAEMRIPFSSLRFQATGDTVRMGLIAGRRIARIGERHTFPAIRPGPNAAQFKPSLAAEVVLEGIQPGRRLEIRPYGLGEAGRHRSSDSHLDDRTRRELGLDLKQGIGDRLTLDVTVNTDFAETEADDERLNLTRFDLVFPEKRHFFLEQAGTFDFGEAGSHRLFYSRRVGLTPDGRPERIHGGARVTGRVGEWDLGLMDLHSAHPTGGSRNLSVARVRRRFSERSSWLGAIGTGVMGRGERRGAGGVDGQLQLSGSRFLVFHGAGSHTAGGPTGSVTRISLEDRERQGLSWRLSAARVGRDYDPPLGFVLRQGVSSAEAGVSLGGFGRPGWLQSRIWTADGELLRRHQDGRIETAVGTLTWEGQRRGGGTARVQVRAQREHLLQAFHLSEDAHVPAGDHRFVDGALTLGLPSGWRGRAVLELAGGEYFDGRRVSAAVRPSWNVSPHLELSADLEANHVTLPERHQRFKGTVAGVRVRAALDTRLSAHGLLQYNEAHGRAAANVRVRYHFREGQDLFVVWNEGRIREGIAPGHDRWLPAERALTVKYAHAIRW